MNNSDLVQIRRDRSLLELRNELSCANQLMDIDIEELIEVLKLPIRSLAQCKSKTQLKELCIKLLIENIDLKRKLKANT